MFSFPFQCPYKITQGYADNFNNYPEGHHGALDIVPLDSFGNPFPAPVFPLFEGSELSIQDTDPIRGKGVKERIVLDSGTIQQLISLGLIPKGSDQCYLDVLYWHLLDVTDKDGSLEPGTPLGHTGNTGDVYHDGLPVPNNEKGVPPYPGLHLHLETVLTTGLTTFNLDKDPRGRINPAIFFDNSLTKLHNMKIYIDRRTSPPTIVPGFPVNDEDNLKWLAFQCGTVIPQKPDGTVDWDKMTYDGEIH